MAFTNGFSIDLGVEFEIEFAEGNYTATSDRVFGTDGFELDVLDFIPEFSAANYARPSGFGAYSPGFEVLDEDWLPGFSQGGYSRARTGGQSAGSFTPGFEVGITAHVYLAFDTGLEILFDGVEPVPFLLPFNMTEIIYPVKPITDVDRVLFQVGTEEWKRTEKTAAPVPKEIDTVRFRVDTSYMASFLANLDSNRLNQFRLATPGYTFFGINSEDNYVRVLNRGRPHREPDGFAQIVDVTFLFRATYP